jgi:hypothetical protein
MKIRKILLTTLVVVLSAATMKVAPAHTCPANGDPGDDQCQDTETVDNWRGSYLPLFEPIDREDGDARWGYQRWHLECDNQQFCLWQEFGTSAFATDGEELPSPNEVHIGMAGSHCFLFEAQHDCSDHAASPNGDTNRVHDAHGGAIFIDLCLTPNTDSSQGDNLCANGQQDTVVGVTLIDHNGCGIFVPVAACTDEYHIWKPFDPDYTVAQMERSQAAFQALMDDPQTWMVNYFCGNPEYSEDCPAR